MEAKLQAAEAEAKVATNGRESGYYPLDKQWQRNIDSLAEIESLKKSRSDIVEMLEGFRLWASGFHINHKSATIVAYIGPHCKLFAGFTEDVSAYPGAEEAKFYLHPGGRDDYHGYGWRREWDLDFWSELAKYNTEAIAEGIATAMAELMYGIDR
ncbi:hypothetical protein D3C73_16240 [compost metagenome]